MCLFDNETLSNNGLPHIISVIIKMPIGLKSAGCMFVENWHEFEKEKENPWLP